MLIARAYLVSSSESKRKTPRRFSYSRSLNLFFSNLPNDDMSLSSVLFRPYRSVDYEGWYDGRLYIYIYIHMYVYMFEDIKCFDTDVNFVYTRMTRTFNDDDQCNPWKKVRP